MSSSTGVGRIAAAGDAALVAEFEPRIDAAINDRVTALAAELEHRLGAILRDVVGGYCTVTVYFDPLRVDARWLEGEIASIAGEIGEGSRREGSLVQVPVCYDDEYAPDLADVAAFGDCSPDEVIRLHTDREYRVYMLGFIPGFAYMAEVDPRIAAPRRRTPRTLVPAGAVAIAGGQTGVYPAATPGGWNIIGRTPLVCYDPLREQPSLFRPGDRVQFVRRARDEFAKAL